MDNYEVELVENDLRCPECDNNIREYVYDEVNKTAGDFEVKFTCPHCFADFTLIAERQLHLYLIKS